MGAWEKIGCQPRDVSYDKETTMGKKKNARNKPGTVNLRIRALPAGTHEAVFREALRQSAVQQRRVTIEETAIVLIHKGLEALQRRL